MKLGAYEVEGEIGRGGMGTVFRARAGDGRSVAVKLLQRVDAEKRARFDRERRLLEELSATPGFVPLLDAAETPQGPIVVMPFVTGGTLRDKLRGGRLGVEEAVALVGRIASALGAAHERGIVHRDLKPENVLLDERGAPLVADLGLAKHFDPAAAGAAASVALSRSREMRGTIAYMAPEQLVESRSVGPAADVFALGAILYELLAGEPAFAGDTVHEVVARVANGTYRPLRKRRADTPTWLLRVVEKALALDAASRFADGGALAAALAAGPADARGPLSLHRVALLAVPLVAAAALAATWPRARPAAPVVAPDPTPVSTHPAARTEPDWFLALAPAARPPLPLPRGLRFGHDPGEYVSEKDGSVLVWAPDATFVMGDARGADDEQPHVVEVTAHWIGKYEVTIAQFERFVKATGHVTRCEKEGLGGHRKGRDLPQMIDGLTWRSPRPGSGPPRPDEPVTQVTRDDVEAYVRWAGLRLPSEAEWEGAARWDPATRAGRTYPWGDAAPRGGIANVAKVGPGVPLPVGSFPSGVSAIGAYDLGGNVSEWVADGYDRAYERQPTRDPLADPKAMLAITRGGSFETPFDSAKGFHRHREEPTTAVDDTGFRVARGLR